MDSFKLNEKKKKKKSLYVTVVRKTFENSVKMGKH